MNAFSIYFSNAWIGQLLQFRMKIWRIYGSPFLESLASIIQSIDIHQYPHFLVLIVPQVNNIWILFESYFQKKTKELSILSIFQHSEEDFFPIKYWITIEQIFFNYFNRLLCGYWSKMSSIPSLFKYRFNFERSVRNYLHFML